MMGQGPSSGWAGGQILEFWVMTFDSNQFSNSFQTCSGYFGSEVDGLGRKMNGKCHLAEWMDAIISKGNH